jgi:hypothetical protein
MSALIAAARSAQLLSASLVFACCLPPQAAAQSRAEHSAQDATYACPVPASAEALQARVAELYPSKHDKNALGCAADLLVAAANAQPDDAALNTQALLVTAEYIDHVNTLWDFDLYGVRQPEWKARLEHAIAPGRALAERIAAVDEPVPLCAVAYFDLVWPARTADAKTALSKSRDAKSRLERATARDPAALDGNCLLMIGRLHYELPEFAGGDPERALAELKTAQRLAPGNQSVLRYLAYVQLQERDQPAAQTTLGQMLAADPAPPDRQLFADELRNARDLATRMGDAQLSSRLDGKRKALLAAHPELLTRAMSAANMHGGVDPITGKDY